MPDSSVIARVLDGGRLECQIVSPKGETAVLAGTPADLEPTSVKGSPLLVWNKALQRNAWAYAKFNFAKVNLPTADEQKDAAKRAEAHRDVTKWIADLADDPIVGETQNAWCSGCFALTDHQKVRMAVGQIPAYLCQSCGSPTLPCAGPGCEHMAIRGHGGVRLPRFCAEHRHEIPGFEKADRKLESLGDYREFFEHEQPNLSRTTKLVGVGLAGLAVAAPAAFFAAPAIGGAIGSAIGGYSGAAATSYGLALLGGGSIASGGLGMAGGTIVITAVGATLGCGLGASVTNAYVSEDKSFHIEMLQGGSGTPVLVCNGFLSEGKVGWGEWKRIVTERYPDSPVYRVHWGAKELADLIGLIRPGAGAAANGPIRAAARRAGKAAAERLAPIAPAVITAQLAANPWHVAKSRANKTGAILADLLARTQAESYVMIGHSLGARAMVLAAQTLSTKADGPRLEAVHLLGAAIGARGEWDRLTAKVDGAVYNYFSSNDFVLKWAYTLAEGGQTAAGLSGFSPAGPKLKNIDVTDHVPGHSGYLPNVTLS